MGSKTTFTTGGSGLKTPISYYGGKLNLVSEILPLIPPHEQYIEPFIGGATVLFAKKPSAHEAINDFDNRLITFWTVIKNDFHNLQAKIQSTLHSEFEHKKAKAVLKSIDKHTDLEIAWAYWVQTQMSFTHKLMGGFAFANTVGSVGALSNKKNAFTEKLQKRLAKVEIFNRDAIDLIKRKDCETNFIYLDPPHAESNCGQYEKLKDVYYRLLDLLPTLKSKWLMSSYPSEQLSELRELHGWQNKDIVQNLSVSGKLTKGKTKTECLTWNYHLDYNLPKKQNSIFDLIGEDLDV